MSTLRPLGLERTVRVPKSGSSSQLSLAALPDDGSVLCGTGAGTLERLRPNGLQLLQSLSLPRSDAEAESRVSAVAALQTAGESGVAQAVAGTSTGHLHTVGAGG